jgi:alpha-beta hydrolase superfamily lysophospholipase
METITLKTKDGFSLIGNFYLAQTLDKGVILIHQMNKSKESYNAFTPLLVAAGYNVLALDMRGHGQSSGSVNKFSDMDFNNIVLDFKAGEEFLKSKNSKMKISLIGASISANAALNCTKTDDIASVIALSPGLNFHNVMPEQAVSQNTKIPIMLVATTGDKYSTDSVNQLYNASPLNTEKKEKIIYSGRAHGTDMFTENSALVDQIISWLKKFN